MTSPRPSQRETDPRTVDARRRAPRVESNLPLRIVIESQEFAGQADNLSNNGVFLFSSEKVRVRVEVQDGESSQAYVGRIVRVQQMSPGETGFAIEFDQQ